VEDASMNAPPTPDELEAAWRTIEAMHVWWGNNAQPFDDHWAGLVEAKRRVAMSMDSLSLIDPEYGVRWRRVLELDDLVHEHGQESGEGEDGAQDEEQHDHDEEAR
jgi:hypothetical protein